ncbi:MAG: hemerythrin family protein [Deltaproteobacteria bacterium]|jgi:hemerythrin|nr:hemerythrin family protein [Deltaproteobacteria bacterium]
MIWTKSLETGVPKIDEQHKELFRQADNLVDKTQTGRVEATLNFLKGYVAKHFSDEEILHRVSGYPKADFHKKLHEEFSRALRDMFAKYQAAANKQPVVLTINSAVAAWLREHIMKHDKEFAVYYLAKQAGTKK